MNETAVGLIDLMRNESIRHDITKLGACTFAKWQEAVLYSRVGRFEVLEFYYQV
jgi:hypothetical protein